MKRTQWSAFAAALALLAGQALATPALAGTAPPEGSLAGPAILPPPLEVPEGPGTWSEDFDGYATGMQLHGVGGWKGWDNMPAFGALTSAVQARSVPNSVDILGASDLVHEYFGYTSGIWTYIAHQYIPSTSAGPSYFILLNTYNDGGPYNWSTQVCFNIDTGLVIDDVAADCATGTSLPLVYDQWVELRVVIDLDADTQTFYYGGVPLFTDTWTGHVSGGGIANIGAVDLFANAATSVFYDDMSLSNEIFADGFESGDTNAWSSTVP
ncbi:MAG: hypothetical protein OES32_18375 [Acidobacteriota bacterium]|nr:hypothetical protein [Acidobacteriota bacterium]MDH3525544.1 hypothetical protein [Acidobacteriota bacterium]